MATYFVSAECVVGTELRKADGILRDVSIPPEDVSFLPYVRQCFAKASGWPTATTLITSLSRLD